MELAVEAKQVALDSDVIDELERRFPRPSTIDVSGLVLYYHPYNFFSQKVFIALHEKRIPFVAQLVDICNGEQYSSWFLELNPRADVPVLQNGDQIITESGHILAYVEDHFASDPYVRLLPRQLKVGALEQIVHFNRRIGRLPIGPISLGIILHEAVRGDRPATAPFDRVTRSSLAATGDRIGRILVALQGTSKHTSADQLMSRYRAQEQRLYGLVADRSDFVKLLNAADEVFDEIESHLHANASNGEDWLCCETFTIADLCLLMLLQRLHALGLDDRFWSPKRRPLIGAYFERATQSAAFRRSLSAQQEYADSTATAMLVAAEAHVEKTEATERPDEMDGAVTAESVARVDGWSESWARVTSGHVTAAVAILSVAMAIFPLYASALK